MRSLMFTIPLLAVVVAACQIGPADTHPVPSVGQIGSDLKCPSGDHAFEDTQAGWGFCYPGTWRYIEHAQSIGDQELDLTFGITDIPCTSPGAGQSAAPVCASGAGLFGYMIVSTYYRHGVSDLTTWVKGNLNPAPTLQPIDWGNAAEADKMSDGRRIALTPNHVVILDLHYGQGNLDLESAMSSRLGTWKFLI